VEQKEVAIAMEWFSKHAPVAMDKQAKIELMLFYVVCAKVI
jgi:hypothetical protein